MKLIGIFPRTKCKRITAMSRVNELNIAALTPHQE